jgi:Holliday junction resolvase-like predicted endonuclease
VTSTGKNDDAFSSRHVGVAAEAIAAALFARCGFDVSVQYGANQPEYDLIVADGEKLLKVSVKGSKDGGWGLTQSLMDRENRGDYHGAITRWLTKHTARTVMCFVQFQGIAVDEMPRTYLATPHEVAERLRATASGRGDTILYEYKVWTAKAHGAGTVEEIPKSWRFSKQRVLELLG